MTNKVFTEMLEELKRREWGFSYDEQDNCIDTGDIRIYPWMEKMLLTYTVARAEDDFETYENEVDDVDHAFLMIDYINKEML